MTDMLTRKEAAARLAVSLRTLDGLIARGQLPAYRIGPKAVRLREADLEAYVAGHVVYAKPTVIKPTEKVRPCLYVPGMKVV